MVTKAEESAFKRMSIGDRVRYLIEIRETDQSKLAAKIGLRSSAISNIVNDDTRRPRADTLLKLAEELKCNPQWIMDGVGDPFTWAPVTSESQAELVNLFRGMPDDARQALLAMARQLPKKGKS